MMVRYDGGYDGEEDWIERFSPDIAPYKTKSVKAAKELEAWKDGLVVGARVDLQEFSHRSWFAGTVCNRLEAGAYSPPGNYYQHDTSAHIKVMVVGNNGLDEEKESEWISVNSPRLAKYGTRASGGATEFEDFNDADDPPMEEGGDEGQYRYACEHGKAYGSLSLVAAVNCLGRAGGFSAILHRLQVNGPPSDTLAQGEGDGLREGGYAQ